MLLGKKPSIVIKIYADGSQSVSFPKNKAEFHRREIDAIKVALENLNAVCDKLISLIEKP